MRGILSACEENSKKTQFLQRDGIVLGCAFLSLPGEADRSGFNSESSLLVIAIVYILLCGLPW